MSSTDLEKLGYDKTLYVLAFDHRGVFVMMVVVTVYDAAANFARVCFVKTRGW